MSVIPDTCLVNWISTFYCQYCMLFSPKFTSLYVQSIFCKFPNFHELNIFQKTRIWINSIHLKTLHCLIVILLIYILVNTSDDTTIYVE
jgi:hypothetical protein